MITKSLPYIIPAADNDFHQKDVRKERIKENNDTRLEEGKCVGRGNPKSSRIKFIENNKNEREMKICKNKIKKGRIAINTCNIRVWLWAKRCFKKKLLGILSGEFIYERHKRGKKTKEKTYKTNNRYIFANYYYCQIVAFFIIITE